MWKWQIKADEVLVGETGLFEFEQIHDEDITQQRWQLMSDARDAHPNAQHFEYHLVKVK